MGIFCVYCHKNIPTISEYLEHLKSHRNSGYYEERKKRSNKKLQFKDLERKGNILLRKKNLIIESTNQKIPEKKNVASEKASLRLIDVAKEFKVTVKDISIFLKSRGYKIDARPNIKINNEQYNLLKKRFVITTNRKPLSKKLTFKRMIKNFVLVREKEGKTPAKLKKKKVYLKKVRGGRPESNRRKF